MNGIKRIRTIVLTAAFLLLTASSALAGAQDFILVNRTGYDIYAINVSPSDTEQWEEDILGSKILANGEVLAVRFPAIKTQFWDIQVKFKDGSGLFWLHIDLLNTKIIMLNPNGTATMRK